MKNSHRRRVELFLVFSILLVIIISPAWEELNSRRSAQASEYEVASGSEYTNTPFSSNSIANCRYGIVAGRSEYVHVPRIGAGWFLDFNPPDRPKLIPENNAEFVHVFKTFQEKSAYGQYLPSYKTIVPLNEEFASYLQENPGDLWLIGNEVDRGPDPGKIEGGQGDMYPEIYAQAYHDVRAFIKKHDPTARTALSGLVQVTPGRLQYLDKVWNAYQQQYGTPMPVDIWNMHIYILPEVEVDGLTPNGIANIALGSDPTLGKRSSGGKAQLCTDPDVYCSAEHDDIDIFVEQVFAMRHWMKEHGQQQKPLILSEFSIIYPFVDDGNSCYLSDEYGNCFTPDRVSTFMAAAFDHLSLLKDEQLGYAMDDNRLVQQWLWFSMYSGSLGVVSNILEPDKQTLTQIGESFKQTVFAEPSVVNLVVEKIPRVVVPVDQSGKATALIAVMFRNNGNMAVEKPFTVTFYEDQTQGIEIGSVDISVPVRGCSTNVYHAKVEWPDLAPGEYSFWVTIDSKDVIDEGSPQQQDNRENGLVLVNPESSYLPLLLR